jgi:co-chaperonin GroES (HSP10)
MRNAIKSITPIKNSVIVSDMYFGEQKTKNGIIIIDDDGKSMGVKPRWGKVYAIGKDQKDVAVGDWILIEHGRWTRGFELENTDGSIIILRRVDADAIIMISDSKPEDVYLAKD